MAGLSLVELMVAMVLGLLLILAAGNIFIANKQTYRTVENLSRIQESLRFAFELMARDARMAGAIRCGYTDRVANVLNGTAGGLTWNESVRGYGTTDAITFPAVSACGSPAAAGCRVAGTEAIYFSNAAGDEVDAAITGHVPASAVMTLDNVDNIEDGDILLVCRPNQAAIFQVTNVNDAAVKVVHNTGVAGITPGNATKCLNFPVDTSLAPSSCVDFTGGEVAKLSQQLWYIGNNGRGGNSLYRKAGSATAEEIVPDVDDMELSFLTDTGTAYQDVASITDWSKVRGVRIKLVSRSQDKVGTDSNEISRDYTFTVSLRNRLK
ncbi:MAG TPA: pilus assembly protein PilW [Gammaproteobacteria bacterium]|nr:pilus assembly protein PilW [Gammaproteobacteria bacterium]